MMIQSWKEAKQTNPVGFITKPFDETEIQNLIEKSNF